MGGLATPRLMKGAINRSLIPILVLLAGVLPSPKGALPHVYVNDRAGFTIRYPDNLRPVETDPKQLDPEGEMGWKLVVDFVTLEQNPTPVLRVIGIWPTPTHPPMDLRTVRPGCKTYHETTVGGRRAGICVSCGRAACAWDVHVPGPPDFLILSLDPDAGALSEPQDGAYPIKSMIESMRFRRARRAALADSSANVRCRSRLTPASRHDAMPRPTA